MDSKELIELFYSRAYEKFVNKQILDDKDYVVPRQQLTNYVHELVNIPYNDYINYIKSNFKDSIIDISDITQFNSFSSCEVEVCNILDGIKNIGIQCDKIGQILLNNGNSQSADKYRKYGEVHVKAACQLGLTFEYYNYWYLSCLGYIYADLKIDIRKKLLARTIIRNKLYQQFLIDILNHDIDPFAYFTKSSKYMVKSRLYNLCVFLKICMDECRNQGIRTFKIIDANNYLNIEELRDVVVKERNITLEGIPYSGNFSIEKIKEIFIHTTTTYKYFWFISILQLYKENQNCGIQGINVLEIIIRMISNAWHPLLYYDLSFGEIDSFKKIVKNIKNETNISDEAPSDEIIQIITSNKTKTNIYNQLEILWKNVPYRCLSPWIDFSSESNVISQSQKYTNGCFYSIYRNLQDFHTYFYIKLNPEWLEYLSDNADSLISYAYRKLAVFLEARNPGVNNIYDKLTNHIKEKYAINDYLDTGEILNENCKNDILQFSLTHDVINFSIEDDSPVCKENFALDIIKRYVKEHPNTTWENLTQIFPTSLKNNSGQGVLELLSTVNILALNDPTIKQDYFMDRCDIIKLKKGIKCVVNRDLEDAFSVFLNIASNLYNVKVVYGKNK